MGILKNHILKEFEKRIQNLEEKWLKFGGKVAGIWKIGIFWSNVRLIARTQKIHIYI